MLRRHDPLDKLTTTSDAPSVLVHPRPEQNLAGNVLPAALLSQGIITSLTVFD